MWRRGFSQKAISSKREINYAGTVEFDLEKMFEWLSFHHPKRQRDNLTSLNSRDFKVHAKAQRRKERQATFLGGLTVLAMFHPPTIDHKICSAGSHLPRTISEPHCSERVAGSRAIASLQRTRHSEEAIIECPWRYFRRSEKTKPSAERKEQYRRRSERRLLRLHLHADPERTHRCNSWWAEVSRYG